MVCSSVFVDTGAWYAAAVSTDPDHAAAAQFFGDNQQPLLTTDFIIVELLTLFAARNQKPLAQRWLQNVLNAHGVDMERISQADFEEATQVYFKFADKRWSFTDCTSYVVMRRLGLARAISFDIHFQQFGTVQVMP